jgi:adenosylhomocysteinase
MPGPDSRTEHRAASRAARAANEIARINAFFPIMPLLGNRWAARRPFEGMTLGVSAHLTTLTAARVREMGLGGGTIALCGASAATTDPAVVDLLLDEGHHFYTTGSREDHHDLVLDHEPELLADVGADLIGFACTHRPEASRRVLGAVEVTKSGVNRLPQLELRFPVVNINDGRLKSSIENRHGVGEGLWHALQRLTGIHLSGRRVAVVGYGPVGKGVAFYARSHGAVVEVVETDSVRRLCAHYDGFPTPSLAACIARTGILVTCTGLRHTLPVEMLGEAREGLVIINAGHGGDEVDVAGIKASAESVDQIADHVVSYQLEGGPRVLLLADGHPLNIVMNAGSPEPVLLHFALLGLTMEWLTRNPLPPGEHIVPATMEREAAELALEALSMAHG